MLLSLALTYLLATVVQGQFDPNILPGRTVYVHLFEWKWTDIAAECERFLGPKGFAAIQVSPPNEHRVITEPAYPWWQRYQPVSYNLASRSGNEAEFTDMVSRCNGAGVRIYVDAVINHMAGSTGVGSAGNSYNADSQQYEGVPFRPDDFTPRNDCPTINTTKPPDQCWPGNICDYKNALEVRNCRLVGMPDIAIYKVHPRSAIVGYLDKLVDIGVAGFRVDAAKHMWPSHLKELLYRVKDLNTNWFPAGSRPYVFHEVIDLGQGEPIIGAHYIESGRVTEFKYGMELSRALLKKTELKLKDFRSFETRWPGFLDTKTAVTFIDNHDNQRGHGGGGEILTFRLPKLYTIANAFMLAHPYGFPQVMSSYNWPQDLDDEGKDRNDYIGPPSGSGGVTSDITINELDGSCNGAWRCEHRWREIVNMVAFRNVAETGDLVHWWDNQENQIAFGRGAAGATTAFIVINNDDSVLSQQLQTGLPPGVYCDVISGSLENESCTGKIVTVDENRLADFVIPNDHSPVVALQVEAKML